MKTGYKAIITTLGPKPKTIGADLLQDGLNFVMVAVTNKDGTRSMKKYSKEKYKIMVIPA